MKYWLSLRALCRSWHTAVSLSNIFSRPYKSLQASLHRAHAPVLDHHRNPGWLGTIYIRDLLLTSLQLSPNIGCGMLDVKTKVPPFHVLAVPHWVPPMALLAVSATRAHYYVQCISTKVPVSLRAELPSASQAPSCTAAQVASCLWQGLAFFYSCWTWTVSFGPLLQLIQISKNDSTMSFFY